MTVSTLSTNRDSVNQPITFSEACARLRAEKPPPFRCLTPMFDRIPARLRRRAHWVVWRAEWDARRAKYTKVLYQAFNGAHASSTNPNTWTSFKLAREAYQRGGWNGIGYVLASDDHLVGVDLDHAVKNCFVEPWASQLIKRLSSYWEFSPSGTGIRIFIFARLPGTGRKRGGFGNDGAGVIEIYDRARFLTVTGRAPKSLRIMHSQRVLDAIMREFFFPEPVKPVFVPQRRPVLNIADQAVIEIASAAKNGAVFKALYFGGDLSRYNDDASRADFALMHMLLFYADGSTEQVERLFNNSALGRRENGSSAPTIVSELSQTRSRR